MKILHGIVTDENVGTIKPLGNGLFESGEWDISEQTARDLRADGQIMLHAKQAAPSRHGGNVTGYRSREVQRKGQIVTLYTIIYECDGSCIGVKYKGGWSQQLAIEVV